MHKFAQRGAADLERLQPLSTLRKLSWDDLRVFVACADSGSFREAARSLGLSSSTVTRRIDRLEHVLGVGLFQRLPEGVVLTREGAYLAESARAMHLSLCDLERRRSSLQQDERGQVAIAATEGLGTFWIIPHIVEFGRQHPSTTVNLLCAMESADVLRLEADLAIQFIRPEWPDAIVTKIGRLHVYPFASKSYLDTYGVPESIDDIQHHRLVEQVAPQLDKSALVRYFRRDNIDDIVGIRTNTSSAHFYAIEKGAGIGVLPTFALALGAQVVPVDLGEGYSLDIWLTYHPEALKCRHKKAAISLVKGMFDASQFPWFQDKFIHPRELARMLPPRARINDGRGFFAVSPRRARAACA